MNKKEIYICEYCKKEFDTIEECKKHENNCITSISNLKDIISKFLHDISKQYKINILKLNIKGYDRNNIKYCQIDYIGQLNNKNILKIYNSISKIDIPIFKKDTINEINNLNILEYIGELHDKSVEFGYNEYFLDNTDVSDICKRLNGRKVRIEVIQ
jgi:predicted HAD superfamily phosphohydrolase